MDNGPSRHIFYRPSKNLVCEWSGVPFAKEDETHNVRHWVDVGPVEVDMGNTLGNLLQVNQKGGGRVGHDSTSGMQYSIRAFLSALNA
jgi:Cu2+-containing amine oxidase